MLIKYIENISREKIINYLRYKFDDDLKKVIRS